MGNDSSQSADRRAKFLRMFFNNYELAQERIDQLLGEISLYRNKNTSKLEVVTKTLSYGQQDLSCLVKSLEERVLHPLPNLMSLYHVEEIAASEALCGTSHSFKIYMEYLSRSLRDELVKRRRHKNYFLSEQQLWKILLSLLNATKHLHDHKAIHGEIRVENVLIDEEYHIKLVEKALLSTTNWSIELGKENITLIRGRGVLFSPCLLRCLFHQRTQLADYDAFKADVYAVGMILLECASLRNAGEFYDYEKFSVRGSQIKLCLFELRKKYSLELVNTLERMLQEQDVDRPSSGELYVNLRKVSNETIRELNTTLDESFLSESIRSYM